jgi:SulP family sulfate permease
LLSLVREGYGLADLRADAAAAVTVAVVALPVAMAIAIASGVSPERGLYTSIVGGGVIALLGSTRVLVGGAAGVFIVQSASIVAEHGPDGLAMAILVSGLMLAAIGVLRLGSLIRFIPQSVLVGMTAGIALNTFASQLKDLAGLTLHGREPGALVPRLLALSHALPTLNLAALAIGIGSIALVLALRSWRPRWPGMLIALVLASVAAFLMPWPVQTIASRFHSLPHGLLAPHWPKVARDDFGPLLSAALSFALLGALEGLVSAKVAERLTQRPHRPNLDLMAQGAANVASAVFGGLSVIGVIGRTAVNVGAGARTPVAGVIHSIVLLALLGLTATLAGFIPLATLAGLLCSVCWTMVDRAEIRRLLDHRREAVAMVAAFALTLSFGSSVGILAGTVVAALLAFGVKLLGPRPLSGGS